MSEAVGVCRGPDGYVAARVIRADGRGQVRYSSAESLPSALSGLGLDAGEYEGPLGVAVSAGEASVRRVRCPAGGWFRRGSDSQSVGFAAEEHLAESAEDLEIRFATLSSDRREREVLAASMRRSAVQAVRRDLTEAGFAADLIGLDAELVAAATLGGDRSGSPTLLVWPTETGTSLVLWQSSRVAALRHLRYPLSAVPDTLVASRFASDVRVFLSAEGLTGSSVAGAVVEPEAGRPDALSGPPAASLPEFRSIALAAGGAELESPSTDIRWGARAAALAAALAVQVDLATRLDWAEGRRRVRRPLTRAWAVACVLAALVLCLSAGRDRRTAEAWEQRAAADRQGQRDDWQSAFLGKPPPDNIPLRMESELRRVQGLAGSRDLPEYRCCLDTLATLAGRLPAGGRLTTEAVEVDQAGFALRGRIQGHVAAEALSKALAGSGDFVLRPPRSEVVSGGMAAFWLRGAYPPPPANRGAKERL